MKKKIMNKKVLGLLARSAMLEAKKSINSACLFWHHQPIIPKELEDYQKK